MSSEKFVFHSLIILYIYISKKKFWPSSTNSTTWSMTNELKMFIMSLKFQIRLIAGTLEYYSIKIYVNLIIYRCREKLRILKILKKNILIETLSFLKESFLVYWNKSIKNGTHSHGFRIDISKYLAFL